VGIRKSRFTEPKVVAEWGAGVAVVELPSRVVGTDESGPQDYVSPPHGYQLDSRPDLCRSPPP
jgi:hypothetical protein